MSNITTAEITKFIEENIPTFHQRRLETLCELPLKRVLLRKNPYLFKAKDINTAENFVSGLLDAYLSSQEETIFGGFLEGLAIFICNRVYGAHKSTAEGVDMEFEKDEILHIVSIKSGPNWGNSSQIKKMKQNFRKAKKIVSTNNPKQNVIAINGCCYGRDASPVKDEYQKLCGQDFWKFISGIEELYTDIIEPLGHTARQRNEEFSGEYGKVVTRFTREFIKDFCHEDGTILWKKIVEYNSANLSTSK